MRTILLLIPLLAGCSDYQHRLEITRYCWAQAGPRPYAAADAFGLIGGLYAMQQPERQAWQARVTACIGPT